MSLYVPKRQVELQTAMVDEDMEPEEREACEEVMLQSIIEASLKEYKDDIVETNLGVALARPRHVSEVDEQVVNAVLFEEIDEDKIGCLESIYGTPASISVEEMKERLERRKVIHMIEEPIRLTDLFPKIDRQLMRRDK